MKIISMTEETKDRMKNIAKGVALGVGAGATLALGVMIGKKMARENLLSVDDADRILEVGKKLGREECLDSTIYHVTGDDINELMENVIGLAKDSAEMYSVEEDVSDKEDILECLDINIRDEFNMYIN